MWGATLIHIHSHLLQLLGDTYKYSYYHTAGTIVTINKHSNGCTVCVYIYIYIVIRNIIYSIVMNWFIVPINYLHPEYNKLVVTLNNLIVPA